MQCSQCLTEMQKHTPDAMSTPDACHVYWCSQCGTIAKVQVDKTAFGRTRTSWLMPVGEPKSEAASVSAIRVLASLIWDERQGYNEANIEDLLRQVVDERLVELVGKANV